MWDDIVWGMHGEAQHDQGVKWIQAPMQALGEAKRMHAEQAEKKTQIARRMWEIVEREKDLADREKAERRHAKREQYKERRLARKMEREMVEE